MFSRAVASGSSLLSDLKMPSHGKRSMPPPPPPASKKQKQFKNLNSENLLLAGNTRMDDEDSWQFDLLEASENDFPPEEFEIPPGLEAFAEKIGLEWDLTGTPAPVQEVARSPSPSPVIQDYPLLQTGQEGEVWGDLMVSVSPTEVEGRQFAEPMAAMGERVNTGITMNYTSPSPSPVFQDYPLLQTGQEEEVWGDIMVSVSPMEVEGRQFKETVAAMGQTVTTDITMNDNNNQGKMNQVILLTEQEMENIRINEKIPQFTEADYEELDSFLKDGLESLLDEKDHIVVDEGQKFDIVKYAVGEAGLGLDQDDHQTEEVPTKTTRDTDEDYVPDFKKIKTEPEEIVEMKPVENVSIEVVEETPRKRRVGRPKNTAPITVTVIPDASDKLSDNELKALKYKRTRELNNKASRRFRQKKKELEEQSQQELEQLRARNYQLQETADRMERGIAILKAKVSKFNQ